MHAVIRTYSGRGAKELFDLLENRKSDVDQTMRSIQGFVSYLLVRTADGGTSVTVCKDKAGADQSLQRARDWIAANASGSVPRPEIFEGPVILHVAEPEVSRISQATPVSPIS
jgi:hypothetical protein